MGEPQHDTTKGWDLHAFGAVATRFRLFFNRVINAL
jgi:hypothetical protein